MAEAHNNVPSTVFRFVTVRGPRKPTRHELSSGFIAYDKKLKSSVTDALVRSTPKDSLVVAKRFQASKAYCTDPEQINEQQAGLLQFSEWLAAEAHRIDGAGLKTARKEFKTAPKSAANTWLWDNLSAHVLLGGRPEIRETLIGALRANKLLEWPELDTTSDETLRRLAVATVLMPVRDSGPDKPQKDGDGGDHPPPAGDDDPVVKKRRELLMRSAAYAEAATELQAVLQSRIAAAKSIAVKPAFVPKIAGGCIHEETLPSAPDEEPVLGHEGLLLSKAALARLSRSTSTLLKEYGIDEGRRITDSIDALNEESARLSVQAVGDQRAVKRMVVTGGAILAPRKSDGGKHKPPMGDPSRDDVPYGDFYPEERRKCRIKPLGIADYRRVEQRLFCYEPGEVAHIENVMQGEEKERVTRHLRRTEETLTTSTEEETTKEKDSQTTDRFEIEKEASKVVESELSFEMGVSIQASYGPVKIAADTKFAVASSTVESDKQAATYGRDVTERALERIVTRVREERISKILDEFEETNTHKLEGGKDEHVVGLFRWVDKFYEARVVNYGKRLMLEFMVPEPAAFHMHAMANEPPDAGMLLEKPIDPRSAEFTTETGLLPLVSHDSIAEWNYAAIAALYEARVEPPPVFSQTTSKAYHREGMDHTTQFADSKNDFKMPEGYEASSFVAPFGLHSENHSGGPNWITIIVGRQSTFRTSGGTATASLSGEDDIVPVALMGRTRFYAINIEILCTRTSRHLTAWKIKVFNAIMDAYNQKLAAYNNALADAKARVGIQIQGNNPARNREIERIELEKSAIRLLAQHCKPLWSNAMKDDQECGYPEFECCEAIRDGSYVQFVEQCFEWRLMTYLFYPYFWGRKCNWLKIYQLEDADPLFLNFLQAGYARVVVPVRPGYEGAALRFLRDGTLWNGGSVPGVNDPMYVSIVNEMMEPVGEVDETVQPWTIKVPTTLTVLQCESGCVDGKGLPCPGPDTPWP